jgi:hypothetical protein
VRPSPNGENGEESAQRQLSPRRGDNVGGVAESSVRGGAPWVGQSKKRWGGVLPVGRYGVRTEGVRTEPRRGGIGGALLWWPDAMAEGKGKGGPVLKGTGQRVAATRHGEVMEGGGGSGASCRRAGAEETTSGQ